MIRLLENFCRLTKYFHPKSLEIVNSPRRINMMRYGIMFFTSRCSNHDFQILLLPWISRNRKKKKKKIIHHTVRSKFQQQRDIKRNLFASTSLKIPAVYTHLSTDAFRGIVRACNLNNRECSDLRNRITCFLNVDRRKKLKKRKKERREKVENCGMVITKV